MTNLRILKRFLLYRICLNKFQKLGFEKVYSYTLGEEAGVTPEQVRKDFSVFSIKGSKRGGYDIKHLLASINNIFKQDSERNVIIIGMGDIGHALVKYQGFRENNINMVAGFDLDPSKYGKKNIIPVYHPDSIDKIVRDFDIKTAILAVPESAGQAACDRLVAAGITAILNFSPVILKVPDNIIVNYVNLRSELESLFYFI
jgi:redox-sensing transcriptional repressor